jgi:hypothetical protein
MIEVTGGRCLQRQCSLRVAVGTTIADRPPDRACLRIRLLRRYEHTLANVLASLCTFFSTNESPNLESRTTVGSASPTQ